MFDAPANFSPKITANIVAELEDSDLSIKVDLVNLCDLTDVYRDQVMSERREIELCKL